MSTIESVQAREILDCKCRPMVEAIVRTSDGAAGRGSAPTGQSVGIHESFVLRDNDPSRYGGAGVRTAVANVSNVLAPALVGKDVHDQAVIDQVMIELDGTEDKSRLGSNAIYATSIAVLRAAAASAGRPVYRHLGSGELRQLPVPCFNVVNGGRYEDFTQPFNEFLIVPYRCETVDEAIEVAVKLFQAVGAVLRRFLGRPPAVASSYGHAAPSDDARIVLELLREAVLASGYESKVAFALDCASSEMFDAATGTYLLLGERASSAEIIEYVRALSEDFDLIFVEDLLDQDDWDGYRRAKQAISRTLLLGDDLIVTNRARLSHAVETNAVDGFVLKPSQVGTITEALQAHAFAVKHGLVSVPSGRSGGAIDDIVMDLSVGLQAPFQKNGAPRSGERIEKLNFLLRAADEVPGRALADLGTVIRF